MPDRLEDAWNNLPVLAQDIAVLAGLVAPLVVIGLIIVRRLNPTPLAGAMLWRYRFSNALFVTLIAISVGIGVGLISQERALRTGTANAADKFDLIIAAPGSEMTMMLAAVYLQPSDVPLLDGQTYSEIANHENVDLAAPIAFGDSYRGAPVVGTTADFIDHLTGGLEEGEIFTAHTHAVSGALAPAQIGDTFEPAHGHGAAAEQGAHAGVTYEVVGRMPPTGSPWDRAILVPVEAVWDVHGLAIGHAPERADQIGPPFDAEYFPGTPAVLVRAEALWANYSLRSEFTRGDTMAFFPGAVLAQLHSVMGDVRQVMSIMAIVTQILVAASVLTGLVILMRLFARRLALLRALGAPDRYVFAVVWSYAGALIGAGALLGLVLGYGAARVISRIITQRTDILVQASVGWPEIHLVAGFVAITMLLALAPAFMVLSRNIITDLRA
ncbi:MULTISPECIES: FtsX-like permease family protein [unclassified Roseitalea]|uniref:FtsX-like permease family protein n=1 Tax=unclassified Roseitalea TaxID=2639107 RepID=UPI00273E3434|nr:MULTISPECIES: FtsX-like permease family protein [unclassified Roseitalea]